MTAADSDAREGGLPEAAAPVLRPRCVIVWLVCLSFFFVAQYGRLGHPLLWQDEAETAMFGRRVLDHGYPKVHGAEGVVYGMSVPMTHAVDVERDAYTGSLWGQYYVAALGVALSDFADGDHARTALVRLPFCLAGTAGLWLLWLAYARGPLGAFGDRRRRVIMACAYWLAMASSVSLLLHLREARYSGLVMLCVGVLVFSRRRMTGLTRFAAASLGLVALFNVFYPAAVAVAGWWGIEAAVAFWHRRGHEHSREATREFVLESAPVLVAALCIAPIVVAFRMWDLGALMSARYQFGLADYAINLAVVARHLLQHEFLVAALLLRIAAWQLGRSAPGRAEAPSLWRLVGVWILVGARNPIFFERYFVALGPLIALAGLLDFARLWRSFEVSVPDTAQRTRMLGAVAAVVVLGSLSLKAPELVGRTRELVTPVEGPLDVAIPWVRDRWSNAAPPLVATNYEAEAWMFYLGGRVVGRFHGEGEAAARIEAAAKPDFVVPRKGYPHTIERLRRYIEPGRFERHSLEVADLPYNTIPELSEGRVLSLTHPFETLRPEHPGAALEVWQRRPEEGAP